MKSLNRLLRSALVVAMCAIAADSYAQMNVSLMQPPPNQLKVSDLWRVTITNLSHTTYTVYLEGTATEANAGQVVDAQTGSFQVPPGTKIMTGTNLGNIKVNSSNSQYKNILLQTGTVPAGNYTVCVIVHNAQDASELATDCIQQEVQNASIIPISPTDGTALESGLPLFIWTSSPPLDPKATYTIKFVEVLGNQTPYAAIQANSPFFQQMDIHTSTLQYPISAPAFIPGRTYAWQVTGVENGSTIAQGDVWGFSAPQDTMVQLKKIIKLNLVAQFEKAYGGTNLDHSLSVQQTKDSGYIIAGYTRSFGAGNDDGYLIKTDKLGAVLWSKTYGGPNDDAFYGVQQCPDGGYVAIGYTRSFEVGNDDIYVVKTNRDGDVEWSKVIGGGGYDAGYAVAPWPDGSEYTIAGVVGKGDDFDGFVAVLDKGGQARWAENFGGYDCDVMKDVKLAGGTTVLAGYTRSYGLSNDDMYILTLNRDGAFNSSTTYGSIMSDRACSIAEINPDLCFIAGYRPGESLVDGSDISLVRFPLNGSPSTARDYNSGRLEYGISASPTPERGLVVGGYVLGDSAHHNGGAIAMNVNYDGNVLWSRLYTNSLFDQGYGIASTFDGGVAMCGWTDLGSGNGDAVLFKTDKLGVVGCSDQDAGMKGVDARYMPKSAFVLEDKGIVERPVTTIVMKAPTVVTILCPKQ